MNKICITNQNHRTNLSLANSGPRQVNFLDVWGDAPATKPSARNLDSFVQSYASTAVEKEPRPANKIQTLIANLCSIIG